MKDYIEAHRYCSNNKDYLLGDNKCGCFYCLSIFQPNKIEEWLDYVDTALCPFCGIDSIIGESSGYPITLEFLSKMNSFWFLQQDNII